MEVLAKPWNGLIMTMLAEGPLRFSELGEKLSAIGDRMLAERLKELEARGLVLRHVEEGPPVRVRYELSDCGRGFSKVSDAIGEWGEQLPDMPSTPQAPPASRRSKPTTRKPARTKGTQARQR